MKSTSEQQSPLAVSKKQRALPCVWMRFWHLNLDESFFVGRRQFVRTGLFTARPFTKLESPRQFVAPWTRVKTTRLVRRKSLLEKLANKALAAKSPFLNMVGGGSFPSGVSDEIRSVNPVHPAYRSAPIMPTDDGKTHFVGDDCPGGHRELTDQIRPRVEQPNSDNNVIGPTS